MTLKMNAPLASQSNANGGTNYAAANANGGTSYAAANEALRQENARLKDLVVQLSAIIAKDVIAQKKAH